MYTLSVEEAVTIIIIAHNNRLELQRQLRIYGQDLPKVWKVCVVDNGSSDGSPATIKAEFPWAIYLETKAYLSIPEAINQGLAFARSVRSQNAFLQDAAIICQPEVISQLLEKQAAIVGPVIKVVNHAYQGFIVGGRLQEKTAIPHLQILPNQPPKSSNSQPAFLPWHALLIREGVLAIVKTFPTTYANGFCSIDFCLQAKQAGFKVQMHPLAIVSYAPFELDKTAMLPLRQIIQSYKAYILRYSSSMYLPHYWKHIFWMIFLMKMSTKKGFAYRLLWS